MGADPIRIIEALKLESGSSAALTLLNTAGIPNAMVTAEVVAHLAEVETLDMEIFDQAMREASLDASAVTMRGLSGAMRLAKVVALLNPHEDTK